MVFSLDRRILKIFLFLGMGLMFNNGVQANSSQMIEVVEIAWTNGISQNSGESSKNFNPETVYQSSAPRDQPLYLWMRIKGYQKALDRLKKQRKVTIKHYWRHNSLGWQTEIIDISIGKKALSQAMLDKLSLELKERGYFDWRTYSVKRNFGSNEYSVNVVGRFGRSLDCAAKNPCEMKINLTSQD